MTIIARRTAIGAALLAASLSVAPLAHAQDQATAPANATAPDAPFVDPSVPVMSPAQAAGATPIAGDAVYKAFHEEAGIKRVVHDMLKRVTTDPRIERHFEGVNLHRLSKLLAEEFCYLAGGPCQYTGDDIKTSHQGLEITDSDFNALVEDLQKAMDQEGVPFPAQNRLLANLAPMQRMVVTK